MAVVPIGDNLEGNVDETRLLNVGSIKMAWEWHAER